MKIKLLSLLSVLLLFACQKEELTTGSVTISLSNVSLYNTDKLFVSAGIYLDEDDELPLKEFISQDLGRGGAVTYEMKDLNPGNYYFRYTYETNSIRTINQPFQIQVGESLGLDIEL